MLDRRHEGALDRSSARQWLRCAGWCLPDDELNQMLSTTCGWDCTRWDLKHLMDVTNQNLHRENLSVETLDNALRKLASGRGKIQRDRLLDIMTHDNTMTEANANEILAS